MNTPGFWKHLLTVMLITHYLVRQQLEGVLQIAPIISQSTLSKRCACL